MKTAIEVVDRVGMGRLIQGPVTDLAEAVLEAEGCAGAVTIAFVDELQMTHLNGCYRGLDEPTDVLSFRDADGESWAGSVAGEAEMESDLGEIAVCPSVVSRYAVEEGADPRRQMGWTLIHGLLHLAGYDHETDDGEMRRREQELLAALKTLIDALPAPREGSDGW